MTDLANDTGANDTGVRRLDATIRPTSRTRRLIAPIGLAVLGLAGCILIAARNPSDAGSFGSICPIKATTGLECPVCGGLRCLHAALTGNLSAAVQDNALLLLALPITLAALTSWLVAAWTGRSWRAPRWLPSPLIIPIVAVVWMVVRNLPDFPLHPLG